MKRFIFSTIFLLTMAAGKAQTAKPLMDSVSANVCSCIMATKDTLTISRAGFMNVFSVCVKKHMMPVIIRLAAEDGTELKDARGASIISAKLGARTGATCAGMKELIDLVNKKEAEIKQNR